MHGLNSDAVNNLYQLNQIVNVAHGIHFNTDEYIFNVLVLLNKEAFLENKIKLVIV